jgi:hypothetical protein
MVCGFVLLNLYKKRERERERDKKEREKKRSEEIKKSYFCVDSLKTSSFSTYLTCINSLL